MIDNARKIILDQDRLVVETLAALVDFASHHMRDRHGTEGEDFDTDKLRSARKSLLRLIEVAYPNASSDPMEK